MFLAWILLAVSAASKAPATSCAGPGLQPGQVESGEIGERSRWFRLEVERDRLVRISARQDCHDFSLVVWGPGGEESIFDTPIGRTGSETAELVAGEAGGYCVELRPLPGEPAGRFELRLDPPRPAEPADRERVARDRDLFDRFARRSQGLAPEAQRRLLEEGLAAWRQHGSWPWQAELEIELAILDQREGRGEAARSRFRGLYEEALRRGDGHVLFRTSFYLPRESAEAFAGFERAAQRAAEDGCPADELGAANAAAVSARHRGDFEAAQRWLDQALALTPRAGDPAGAASAWTNQGVLWLARGEPPARALGAYEQARSHAERLEPGEDRHELENSLRVNEAAALYYSGRMQDARAKLEEALVGLGAREPVAADLGAYHNLGSLFATYGATDRAVSAYSRGLELARALGNRAWEVLFLISQGSVAVRAADYDGGRRLLEQARALAEPESAASAAISRGLGIAARETGQPLAARRFFEDSAIRWERLKEPNREAEATLGLAEVLELGGEAPRALDLVDRGLARLRDGSASVIRADLLACRARLLLAVGRPEQALASLRQAIEFDESLRGSVVAHDLRSRLLARRRERFELEIELHFELAKRPGADAAASLAEAFRASEKARARSFAETLSEARLSLAVPPVLAQAYRDKEKQFQAVQSQWLDQAARLATESPEVRGLAERRRALSRELQGIEEEIRSSNRAVLERLPRPEPPSPGEIQAALGDGEALVELLLGERRGFVFVITKAGITGERLPVGAIEVRAQRDRLLAAIADGVNPKSAAYREPARALFDQLLGPVSQQLAAADRLILVVDGPLHRLPFDALLLPGDGGVPTEGPLYLVRRWAVSQAASATVWAQMRSRPAAPAGSLELLAFADPTPPGAGTDPTPPSAGRGPVALALARLRGAREEVRRISLLFRGGDTSVLEGAEATEQQFKAAAGRARFLHFAVHNYFDESSPDAMSLILAAGGEDNGLLSYSEIAALDLGAELVVLSACDSARGDELAGEGVIGLARAFLFAGAHSLVTSLWVVDDIGTPELMTRFYEGIQQGKGKAEALRLAKLSLIAARGPRAQPRVWAPFVLFGAR
ncbi:MAG TPA: CHAT domain-containing tetratricopeptide repeat protein [Thermoanaerobaculia bacterium]|nr:CHAT domain-containing tetratricopeptide repeat protein [Thermoanaerobaculia bacterium]